MEAVSPWALLIDRLCKDTVELNQGPIASDAAAITDSLTARLAETVQATILCSSTHGEPLSSGEQHVPRPPSYILGASTTTATVCVPVGKAHSTELAAAGGAGATGTTALGPVAAAQDEDDAANSEEDAAGDGGGRPRRGKQPTRKKPGQRSGHLEVRLDWYAQAAVVCQPATCIDTTTDYGSEGAGGGEGVEGGGGTAGASRGAGARSRRAGGRVARLCHVREGRLEELSTAAERGVRRVPWDEYGLRVVDLTCGASGQGALVLRHSEGDGSCPWGVSHVVLLVMLDSRPLADLQARLAAAGCDRPLPRRLLQPTLTPAAELGLLRGALAGALGDAKAQLQQLQLLFHGQQQDQQVQAHEQYPGAGQVDGDQQLERGVEEGGSAGAELLVAAWGSEGGLGVVELAAGAGAGGSAAAAAGGADPAAFDTGSFLMSRLEARLNVALPAVAEAVARMVGRAYNPNLPTYACRALGCSLPDLEDTLYGRLCANISTSLERTAAAKASKKRGRAAGNEAGDGDGSGSMEGGAYGGGSEEEGDGERVGVDEEMILDAGEVLLLGGGGGGSEEFGTAGGYGGDSEQGVGWEQQGSEWAGDQVWDGGEEREQGGEEDETEEPEGGEPEWSEAAMERDWHGPQGHQGASRWGSEARGFRLRLARGKDRGRGGGRRWCRRIPWSWWGPCWGCDR